MCFDTDIIFARVMCLLSAGQIKLDDVFSYELSPIPDSLFKENGEMRMIGHKADLRNRLKEDVSVRIQDAVNAVIIDGCAMLYAVYWPTDGTVNDLIQSIKVYLKQYEKFQTCTSFSIVILNSPKGSTRNSRSA